MEIRKIPIKTKEKPRVCAYVRVSSEKDKQMDSFEFQSKYWNERFSTDADVEFVGLFADEGISGKAMRNRKGLNTMLDKARDGEIDRIYTKSISRFARNYTENIEVIHEMRDMGIPIIFEKENINTLDPKCGLILTVYSSLAEQELISMSKNQSWSARRRFAEGVVDLSKLYGYDIEEGKLVVNPEEAKLVKHIFNLYLNGNGIVKICTILENEGYKTLSGSSRWNKSTINSILKNEKYIGDSLLQKCFYDTVKHKTLNKGELPQYYVEDTHEPIITKEEFERVRNIFAENVKRYHPANKKVERYALTGKLICGVCGDRYARKVCAKGTSYATIKWSCRTKDQRTKAACASNDIKDEVIKRLLIDAYNESLDAKTVTAETANSEEILRKLLSAEDELRKLHAKGYISDALYKQSSEDLIKKINLQEGRLKADKAKSIDISKYKKSAEFIDDMADFLIKATVKDWTVTFEFANGYITTKSYTNGRAGNVNGKLCKHKT